MIMHFIHKIQLGSIEVSIATMRKVTVLKLMKFMFVGLYQAIFYQTSVLFL